MFGILKKVRDVATAQNCEAVMNACGRAVAAALSSKPEKVEAINASKLRTFRKCDDSYTFALYADKLKDGTYYVVYVPRTLKIWRTRNHDEAELLKDQLNSLKLLVNIFEKISSKQFATELEQLRDSVIKHPNFNDIHHAAACNFPTVIHGLCKDHPNIVNKESVDGYYPLHIAVENDAKEAVQVLLSLGAHTAKQDCHSRSAVHYGAENNPEILQLLAGAHDFLDGIDVIDENGLSPLCLAICSAKEKCVELLLDAGCSTGPFPGGSLAAMVSVATSSPDLPRIVDLLLIRAPQFLVEEVGGSSTILHEKLELKLLYHILGDLGDVININIRNGMNQTPLHCAVVRKDLSQSFAFLTYNADVNIANYEGDTPLHISAKNGDVDLVKLLLCFGASVQLKNDHGKTALDVGNGTEIMECLKLFAHSPSIVRPVSCNILSDFMQERALEERYQMTSEQKRQLVNVISFDGGGIRGLILLQTLIHIEKILGHSVIEHFDWLCGTSTGAMIALALAKGYSLKHCQNLYLCMKDELFVGRRPYSEKMIESFLRENFGEETTMAQLGPKKVIVTASCVRRNPPVLKLFRNYTLPISKAENKALGFDNPSENVVWKCARYSSAAPTFFTPKDNFVDGGLMSNNPTLDLLSDIHKKEIVRIGCIVSLGTGQAPPEELGSMVWNFSVPGGIVESVSMFQDLMSLKNLLVEQITASNGPCVTRARSWAHDQSIPFFRFSPLLSSHVELDERDNKVIVGFLWDTEVCEVYFVHLLELINSYMDYLKIVLVISSI
uniref:phospholipase A2 n=1 Tax=Elaeophora elaphi TaxID=1147741 RepID=A0A0R3RPL9_9BILA